MYRNFISCISKIQEKTQSYFLKFLLKNIPGSREKVSHNRFSIYHSSRNIHMKSMGKLEKVSTFDQLPKELIVDPPVAFLRKGVNSDEIIDCHSNYCHGDFVLSTSHKKLSVFNPSNSQVILNIPDSSNTDVDLAVQSAYNAQHEWKRIGFNERAKYLNKLADLIEKNQTRFMYMESFDNGKPLKESECDIQDVISAFRVNSEYAKNLMNDKDIVSPVHSFKHRLVYEPYGVVALITPWNYPLLMAIQKVAPALAAGNTCILKPSEFAVISCIEFAKLCSEAELPKGVFNLINGRGSECGEYLVKHPLVRKISFTGSVPTGRAIMRNASELLKPVHLELGGKSPMIVFDDANLDTLIDWIMVGIFCSSGQICSATSRILISRSIYDEVCQRLKAKTEKLVCGKYDYSCESNFIGPLISKEQYIKVVRYLSIAKEEKLGVLIGGIDHKILESGGSSGYFVPPTIYRDVPTSSALWKDEIFGPVLCLRPFDDENEAIKEANNTEFGLASAVMSANKDRLNRVSKALESGVVWQNCSQPVSQYVPFGGYKLSGYGKECGMEGFMEYLQIKLITSCEADYSYDYFDV